MKINRQNIGLGLCFVQGIIPFFSDMLTAQ